MIKYRTRFGEIKAIEVEREPAKQVTILVAGSPIRENKVSSGANWHDTWEAAHAFLIAEAERNVISLRTRLEQAKGKLGRVKGMKPL